jgi:hypothetical protein
VTPPAPAAFYCVADERYFLGAVGMINSLRLHGHDEPVFLLDCGLTAAQRERLSGHVTLVAAPGGVPPYLMKTIAPLRHPAEVTVLIDADMIVTRPLHPLIARASQNRIVAFENDRDRFVAEWGELLGLGALERRPYVTSGLVLLGGAEGAEVLRLLDDRQRSVEFGRTPYAGGDARYPFAYPEQDVLNAILCARPDPARIETLGRALAATPPYRGLRAIDVRILRCAYADGAEPYVLHQYVRKPWLERMYHGIYPRLLARLLLGDDVAISVPESDVPLQMRSGPRARVARAAIDATDLGRWYLSEVLPARVRALRGTPEREGGG